MNLNLLESSLTGDSIYWFDNNPVKNEIIAMIKEFLGFVNENRLFSRQGKVLLAVSGGIDSMVMASLFLDAGINHAIAHCNFSLRGSESDGDEKFVGDYAAAHNIPFFTVKFDTLAYAAARGISVQMAARELRYEWFGKIVTEEEFDAVSVAHNLNDNVETFFINLLRGTGITGLTGMRPHHGIVIRPLLFATREEIKKYAGEKGITYREDSSNQQIKYTRNRIRHRVLPELEGVTPNSLASISATIEHLNNANTILDICLEDVRKSIFKPSGDDIKVDVKAIQSLRSSDEFIFELFRTYGLTGRQTGELLALMDAPSGKHIVTQTHKILKDRNSLYISEKTETESPYFEFWSIDDMRISGLFSDLSLVDAELVSFSPGDRTAYLDLSLINFPLSVRRWQPGDRFTPFGMNGFKKISDFLIDEKIPVNVKDKVLVLLSGDTVIWVIGHRTDDRFRVTEKTEKVLMISI